MSQVLLERTGTEDILFEPGSANEIENLDALYEELDWVDCASQDLSARHGWN